MGNNRSLNYFRIWECKTRRYHAVMQFQVIISYGTQQAINC